MSEKQRKSMRTSELDKIIRTLEDLERIDSTSEYHKRMAVAYLKNLADYLDERGVKTIKMRPEAGTSSGAHTKNTN